MLDMYVDIFKKKVICICVWPCMYHSTNGELRGQLSGVWDGTRAVRLGDRLFNLLIFLALRSLGGRGWCCFEDFIYLLFYGFV